MASYIKVYHNKYGEGIIIESKNTEYIVKFQNGLLKIPKEDMNKYMLFKGIEYNDYDYKYLTDSEYEEIEDYIHYFPEDYDNLIKFEEISNYDFGRIFENLEIMNEIGFGTSNDDGQNIIFLTSEECNNNEQNYEIDNDVIVDLFENKKDELKVEEVKDKKLYVKRLEKLDGKDSRTIVIINISIIKIKNKKYLRVIGIDVYTSTIVLIIDTNVKEYGLHSYNESLANMKPNTVIKATFKYTILENHANVLRITSVYDVLGVSDITKLRGKYLDLSYKDFIHKFEDIDIMRDQNINKEFYSIVHCTGTKLINYTPSNGKSRLQIKIGQYVANLKDNINLNNKNNIDTSKYENFYFRGDALISCKFNKDKKFIDAINLWGRFFNEEDLNNIKEEIKYIKQFSDQGITSYEEFLASQEVEEPYYEDKLDKAFRYHELSTEYDHQTSDNYVLDGCDDSYFSGDDELEDNYDDAKFIEPCDLFDDWDADYYKQEEDDWEADYYKQQENDYNSTYVQVEYSEEEMKKKKEFDDTYICVRNSRNTSHYSYMIEDIMDEQFAIEFQKIKKDDSIEELDISEIPF